MGYDEIDIILIKSIAPFVVQPLTDTFNLFIISNEVPDQLKIAKVIPVFKNGDRSQVNNHRPISVLPCFSNLLERLVANRLEQFMARFNILAQSLWVQCQTLNSTCPD